MTELAPILISVYNRFSHFKQAIESLKANSLATDSTLYIVSDGPGRDEDISIINEIRSYCKEITGFHSVNFIFREDNLGGHKCVLSAIEEVLEKHGKIIFLEDDIVVSEDFLEYMNNGLDLYKDDERIFSICAHNIPRPFPKFYTEDIYLWSRYNAWGMATWLDRWNGVDWEMKEYPDFIKDKKKVHEFNKIAYSTLPMLKASREQNTPFADVLISFDMFIKNQYTIYPVKSKIRSIGNDGSGEHCGIDESLQFQKIYAGKVSFPKNIQANKRIYKWRSRHHVNFKRDIIRPLVLKFIPFLRR